MAILKSTLVQGKLSAEHVSASKFTGPLEGTSSYATTASYALRSGIAEDLVDGIDANFSELHVSGDAVVEGDLQINGNLTYVGAEDLRVKDKTIELNVSEDGTATGDANGAGIIIRGAVDEDVQLLYDSAADKVTLNKELVTKVSEAYEADHAINADTASFVAKAETADKVNHSLAFGDGLSASNEFDGSEAISVAVDQAFIKGLGITANSASIAALASTHAEDKAALEAAIASASSSSTEALNTYKESNDARVTAVEASHSAYVTSNDQAVAALTQTVANNKATASAELNAYKEANNAKVAAVEASHSAYVESNNQAVANLTQTVANNKASASAELNAYKEANDTKVNAVESASNAAIAALASTHAADKAALEASISNVAVTASSNLDTAKSEINSRIDGVESANNTAHSEISGTIATLRGEFEQFKADTTGSEAGLESRIKANEDAIDLLNADNLTTGSVDYKVKEAVDGIISGSPAAFDTLKEISDWIAEDETGTSELINRVGLLESTASTNAGTVAELTQTVADNKAAAEEALSDYSASASASQAAYSQSVATSFASASSSLNSVSKSLAQTIADNKTDIEGKLSNASSSLDSRITSVSESFAQTVADNKAAASASLASYVTTNDARVKAAEDAHSAYVTSNDARVAALEASHSAYKQANDARVTTIENTYVTTASYNEYQEQVSDTFTTIENKIDAVQASASADYVKKTGDTMKGNLTMESNSVIFGNVEVKYNSATQALEFTFIENN